MIERTMTYEEFQAITRKTCGGGEHSVRFREVGQHGWTSVDDVLNKDPGGRKGPHWCDASPMDPSHPSARAGRLLGTYDFNTQKAKLFPVWDREKQAYVEQE